MSFLSFSKKNFYRTLSNECFWLPQRAESIQTQDITMMPMSMTTWSCVLYVHDDNKQRFLVVCHSCGLENKLKELRAVFSNSLKIYRRR